jgi:hypothetical protein
MYRSDLKFKKRKEKVETMKEDKENVAYCDLCNKKARFMLQIIDTYEISKLRTASLWYCFDCVKKMLKHGMKDG